MKHTIYIEIPVEVEFTPVKGYPATHLEPGEPAHIADLDWNDSQILSASKKLLNGVLIGEELMEVARLEMLDRYEGE